MFWAWIRMDALNKTCNASQVARRLGKALDKELMDALTREALHLDNAEDAKGFLRWMSLIQDVGNRKGF